MEISRGRTLDLCDYQAFEFNLAGPVCPAGIFIAVRLDRRFVGEQTSPGFVDTASERQSANPAIS